MCKEIYNERIMKFDYGDFESYNFSIKINEEEHGFLTPTSTVEGCLDYFKDKRDMYCKNELLRELPAEEYLNGEVNVIKDTELVIFEVIIRTGRITIDIGAEKEADYIKIIEAFIADEKKNPVDKYISSAFGYALGVAKSKEFRSANKYNKTARIGDIL